MAGTESATDAPVTGSEALTEGIRVEVRARYSPEHSDPARSQWFFLYTIRISNEGDAPAQLLSRHWIIIDGTGEIEEVRGEGVVGKQPSLEPGQSFEYTSGCPLGTPFGSMSGTYEMQRGDGMRFDAEIALFELVEPSAIH
jgi:ApaG protein